MSSPSQTAGAPPSPTDRSGQARRWWGYVALLIVVGIAIRLNALEVGYMGDDYMQLAMLEGHYPGVRASFDLYHFIAPDPAEFQRHLSLGSLPWWTWPELHGGVFRPLSSLTLWLDHALFGADPRAAHAHSLLWWAAMVVSAARLLRHTCRPPLAVLALAVFALDDGVTMNIGWIANRCALIAATFAFAAVLSHIRAREAGHAHGSWRSALAFTLGLAGGEYGLVAFGYLLAWEVARPEGSLRTRLKALAPPAGIALSFVALYALGGYGTHGAQEVYAHPLDAPLSYFGHLAHRLPRALAELWLSMPAASGDLVVRPFFAWLGAPGLDALGWAPWVPATPDPTELFWHHAAISTGALGLFALVVWFACGPASPPRDASSPVTWLVAGAVLGLIPVLVAPAHGRLFTLSTLGASVGLAAVAIAAFDSLRHGAMARRLTSLPLLLALGWTHLIADPAWSRVYMGRFGAYHQRVDRGLLEVAGLAPGESLTGRDVIVFAAMGQTTSLHGTFAHAIATGKAPRSWHTISMAPQRLLVQRPDAQSLIISPLNAVWLDTPPELFFRPPSEPIAAGQRFALGALDIEVLRVDKGGHPTAIRAHFPEPLEATRYVFLTNDQGLRAQSLPAVGATMIVAPPSILPTSG